MLRMGTMKKDEEARKWKHGRLDLTEFQEMLNRLFYRLLGVSYPDDRLPAKTEDDCQPSEPDQKH